MNVLDPVLGGKIRAVLVLVVSIATWVLSILDAVDIQAAVALTIPAVVALISHFTPVGNTAPPALVAAVEEAK